MTDSAGTAAYHVGNPPGSRAIVTRYGVDILDIRLRQISTQDHNALHAYIVPQF
jgi:protein-tyrosine-phosphatase